MNSDNLNTLKDDMVAFIEGHGMRHFPALITEDTPRVWWHNAGPIGTPGYMHESSRNFVEGLCRNGESGRRCDGPDRRGQCEQAGTSTCWRRNWKRFPVPDALARRWKISIACFVRSANWGR